jgi:hypothetical protein
LTGLPVSSQAFTFPLATYKSVFPSPCGTIRMAAMCLSSSAFAVQRSALRRYRILVRQGGHRTRVPDPTLPSDSHRRVIWTVKTFRRAHVSRCESDRYHGLHAPVCGQRRLGEKRCRRGSSIMSHPGQQIRAKCG